MKIAVLSDTHLSQLNQSFCRQVEKLAEEADHFFFLGDSVCAEVLDFLNGFSLFAVSGNMDFMEVRSKWPAKRVVELGGFRFGLIHGYGSPFGLDGRVLTEFENVHCVCFGHSHKSFNQRAGEVLVFNPGAAKSGFRSTGTCGLLSVDGQGLTGRHLPFDGGEQAG